MDKIITISRSLVFVALLTLSCWSTAEGVTSREYEVKAALLYKLGKFATWPNQGSEAFSLCVYGDNPFGALLGQLESRRIKDRPIVVHYQHQLDSYVNRCNIVFVSQSATTQLNALLSHIAGTPVLSISDIPGFAELGGMIELSSANNRIQFRINLRSAKQAQIRLASTLLELASVVIMDEGS